MEKNKLHRIVKNLLLVGIISLLFLPIIQQKLNLIEIKPLNGSFEIPKNPTFSLENWFEGKYQIERQNYLNQSIGFKAYFVKLYNQLHFTLYKQARANGVIVGKKDYLYEENYIKAHLGRDFVGEDEVKERIVKLKKIVDVLKRKKIDLIVVLAPGKGSFYPEFIPESYRPEIQTTTNYDAYKREISKAGIHLLDIHSWFRKIKRTSPHPLFPKTGIHWSKYGELLAADSIINYVNSIKDEKCLPQLLIGDIEISSEMRDTDDDIEKGMNLLVDIKDLKMGYPQFKIQKNNHSKKVKVLTIADSYYWGMFNWGCSKDVFNEGQFWYYNEQIYPDSYTKSIKVADINIIEEVEKNDVIILLTTDANLNNFAFGFIDQLYDSYFKSKSKNYTK
jgi:hypothetical protein